MEVALSTNLIEAIDVCICAYLLGIYLSVVSSLSLVTDYMEQQEVLDTRIQENISVSKYDNEKLYAQDIVALLQYAKNKYNVLLTYSDVSYDKISELNDRWTFIAKTDDVSRSYESVTLETIFTLEVDGSVFIDNNKTYSGQVVRNSFGNVVGFIIVRK